MSSNRLLSLLDTAEANAYYAAGCWQDQTFYSRLVHWAAVQPNRLALQGGGSQYTYAEFLNAVDATARDLQELRLDVGSRIGIWCSSRPEAVIILLACSRMGYVCIPSFHKDTALKSAVAVAGRARMRVLFHEEGWGSGIDESMAAFKEAVPELIYIALPPPNYGARKMVRDPVRALSAALHAPDRVFYLAFTSGTTGAPKGVMHSSNTLLANGRAIAGDLALSPTSVIYCFSPMSHNMGTVGLAVTLSCGGKFVTHSPLDRDCAVEQVIQSGATYVIGVPTHAIDLLSDLRRRGLSSLGHVRYFQLAGSAIPARLAEDLISIGITPQNMYGMTENCGVLYTRPQDAIDTIVRTCGRCPKGMEVTLWAKDGATQVAVGEIGEIGVKGASLMLGYFNDQELTEMSFNREGWFMTGDLSRQLPCGDFEIVGRKKDLIIRGGRNIHPAALEDAVMRHPAVEKAAAFPVPDIRLGERIGLAIICRTPSAVGAVDMLSHLKMAGLSIHEMPEYFIALDRFPMTGSGKILKRELVEMVKDGRLTMERCDARPSRRDAQ